MKIVTNQKEIPWTWVFVLLMPWFAHNMWETISAQGMIFTLRKFYDDPAFMGLILSTNYAFSLTVGSVVAFVTDYIWTPMGRRRPALMIAFFGGALMSFFIPFASTGWAVILFIIGYQFVVDFAVSFEPLTMEVVPPQQRGRSGSVTHWYKTAATAVTFGVLIANFDNEFDLGWIQFNGEKLMYWTNSVVLALCGCLILFFVKEKKPKHFERQSIRKLLVQRFFIELTRPTILRLMGLALAIQTLWFGLLQYEGLLITEQWGYEKSEYGYLSTASLIATVALVPFAGWLSDRFDRLFLLKAGLIGVVVLKFIFYSYIEFVVVGQPSIYAVFAMGMIKSTAGGLIAVACIPLLFDFVPNARLGTLGCGLGFTFALSSFIGTNVMGNWIKFASRTVYDMPEGTYYYFAGYHWLLLTGVLGICYVFYFQRAEKRGAIVRISKAEREESGEGEG
ncbi:MFS transporter [Pelagicoccus sp. SDUM812002]|uniref:MFS transporter n=1 Tax=Pelagicoccus sp. SDUM812002 TaxID=3041266 RepID=UPI00281053DD|nr:MFS transporter [Pelagicoccus sp. SDUM812002]MDQ8186549.1 hypothetical protein [Pelagicoccus sp. SDUM812002]